MEFGQTKIVIEELYELPRQASQILHTCFIRRNRQSRALVSVRYALRGRCGTMEIKEWHDLIIHHYQKPIVYAPEHQYPAMQTDKQWYTVPLAPTQPSPTHQYPTPFILSILPPTHRGRTS